MLREFCEGVGAVRYIRIAMDRETGQPRGFAHVEFADAASVSAAVESLSGQELGGRAVRVDTADRSAEGGNRGGRVPVVEEQESEDERRWR
jgi:nucleolin